MSKTFLVVDDSSTIRRFSRGLLEELGFNVEEAANGQLALDACAQGMPDAILLDWNMPVMSGIDFLPRLRSMPEGGKPVVLFCTTESDMTFIEEALGKGADEFIMKPFDGEILASKLEMQGLV